MGEQFFGNPEDPDSRGLGEQRIHRNGIFLVSTLRRISGM
jgi:hypothetical protein